MKAAGTGHRPNKLGKEYSMDGPISNQIVLWIAGLFREERPEMVYTGMALGFDIILAKVCVAFQIPFTAALPFVGQDARWPLFTQALYKALLRNATAIYVVDRKEYLTFDQWEEARDLFVDEPRAGKKMQVRNIWMVDQLGEEDWLLSVFDGSPGGTKNCLDYAKAKGKNILYFESPEWLRALTLRIVEQKLN